MQRSPDRAKLTRRAMVIASLGVGVPLILVLTIRSGCEQSAPPARCPAGTQPSETRCCAEGQTLRAEACVGKPRACPVDFVLNDDGCVVRPARVRIPAGTVRVGPGDWEAQGLIEPRDVMVSSAFEIDAFEVTVDRWQACAEAGDCAPSTQSERGVPVRGVTFEQARRFCAWAGGGIPTEDAWILAAAGTTARRYPWGNTGAVCRRADWGRLRGPCTRGATGPEWAGLIEEDRTPEGVVGLAGGLAEWVRSPRGPVVRGGSYKSQLATELRTWRRDERAADSGYDDVGVRCMYE
jgi:formylglycine-generating enzyme required for sulfatase activity